MIDVGHTAPSFERQPVFGHPVRVPAGSDGPRGGHLVVFVGSLVLASSRQVLEALQARVREADGRRVQLVAVTSTTPELASDTVPRYHLLFPVVTDPDGVLYQEWGVPQQAPARAWGRALLRGSFDGWMEALTLGLGRQVVDTWGTAAFRVDAQGKVLASAEADSSGALPLDDLLACATS